MNEQRRRELDIPIHADDEHVFIDSYCTCGLKRSPTPRRGRQTPPAGRTTGRPNLDVIERNWSEYR